MQQQLLLAAQVLTLAAVQAGTSDWCYEIQKSTDPSCKGPAQWQDDCQKSRQSPINIISTKARVSPDLGHFTFSGYDIKQPWLVRNNGHTVMVMLEPGLSVSGGGLPATYDAIQFHFHWSQSMNQGSEHTIDGKHFAMEMHIVHDKNTGASSSSQAPIPEDSLAVLAFLIEEGTTTNQNFQPLIEALQNISIPGSETMMRPTNLLSFLPNQNELRNYFRYMGSLTTPKCEEIVVWTVFNKTIQLHKDQIREFSKQLHYDMKINMHDNVRPVQPLGNRIVQKSQAPEQLLPLPLQALWVPILSCLMASLLL